MADSNRRQDRHDQGGRLTGTGAGGHVDQPEPGNAGLDDAASGPEAADDGTLGAAFEGAVGSSGSAGGIVRGDRGDTGDTTPSDTTRDDDQRSGG